MESRKTIKSIFLKISRSCLVAFFTALALLVGFAVVTKTEKITLPAILGIYVLISTITSLICIIIAWVLDLIESVRRDKFSCLTGYVVGIAMLWGAILVTDYFFYDMHIDWMSSLLKAVICVCVIKAGNYIFSRRYPDVETRK